MKVAVVIPTHNRKNYLFECLNSIYKSDYKNIDVIVVDDGSTDGTSREVVAKFPSVRVIQGSGDLWWSRAMNLGIEYALDKGVDYIFALNDDVIVAQDTISELVKCALRNENAIIGSMIYYVRSPNLIWCAGGSLQWPWKGTVMIGNGEMDVGQYNGLREVAWTPGMGTLYPKDVLLNLNFFDAKNMPQYHADADLTLRAIKKGYRVLICSKSKLYNRTESTGGVNISNKKISLQDIYDIFFSLRSPDNVSVLPRFYWRHCPLTRFPFAVVYRYISIVGFVSKRLLNRHKED